MRQARRRAAVAGTLLLAGSLAFASQADLLAQLGTDEAELSERVFSAFAGGTVDVWGAADAYRAATTDGRVAIVRGLIAFARSYTSSSDFARRYAEHREAEKPAAPGPPDTAASLLEEQRKGLREGIAQAKEMAKAMPAMKKDMDKLVAELEQQLAQLGKDPALQAQLDEATKGAAAAEAAAHREALAAWERAWPADPRRLVAARLQAFLDLSATVNFAAATARDPRDGKLRFVDAALERKDPHWKLLYRAGQPAVAAARTAAQEWLGALR